MSRAVAKRQPAPRDPETISDHISTAIDELLQLQTIAAVPWRSANETVDMIDDVNRIGKRLARCGRS